MDLKEYHAQALDVLHSFYEQAVRAGMAPFPQGSELTSDQLVHALRARCSRYADGANVSSVPPGVNDFDIVLEAFSAQVTAMAVTFGMKCLPDAYVLVPGMPGGVR